MDLMNNLTRRGWIVLVIIPGLIAAAGLAWLSVNLWATPAGWCIGSFITCNA